MVKNTITILLVAAMAFISACGPSDPETGAAPPPVPQHQLDALEKAKQVEQKLQEDAERREREMRERGT